MLGSRLNNLTVQLEELRKIGVTGKKLNAPSDDPAAIRPVLNTRKQLSNVDRYLDTMGKSKDTMQSTDSHLENVENIMQRAKEIMTNAINGTLNDKDRTILADELVQLKAQLLDTANGSVDGRYLFAGYQEGTKPFEVNGSYSAATYNPNDSNTWPVKYNGDQNATSLEISTGELIQVNLTGNELFLGTSTWDPDPANPTNTINPNRYDLFAELTQAEEALRNGDQAAMQTSLDDLEGAADQNRRLRSQLGNRASRVEDTISYQEGARIDLKQILSRYEDADAIESFTAITQQETAFQAALSVTSQVSKLSILDYL